MYKGKGVAPPVQGQLQRLASVCTVSYEATVPSLNTMEPIGFHVCPANHCVRYTVLAIVNILLYWRHSCSSSV